MIQGGMKGEVVFYISQLSSPSLSIPSHLLTSLFAPSHPMT